MFTLCSALTLMLFSISFVLMFSFLCPFSVVVVLFPLISQSSWCLALSGKMCMIALCQWNLDVTWPLQKHG